MDHEIFAYSITIAHCRQDEEDPLPVPPGEEPPPPIKEPPDKPAVGPDAPVYDPGRDEGTWL